MTADELRAFELEVAEAFEAGKIGGPVHLSGGNEDHLIEIFHGIDRKDWIFSNWRSHYHALLHGVPRERVMAEIMAGRSMMLHFPEYRFLTSAIVGGILPIAAGVAADIKQRGSAERVWCFIGDMTSLTGIANEVGLYAENADLPMTIVVEDNGLSTNTPTPAAWGWDHDGLPLDPLFSRMRYVYVREWPHYQPLPNQRGF